MAGGDRAIWRAVGDKTKGGVMEASIKEALVNHVIRFVGARGGGVTFVELERALTPHITVNGNYAIELLPNLFLWAGVTPEFIDVVMGSVQAGMLQPESASSLVYLMDGKCLMWPIPKGKRAPAKGYKTEHWAPITFSLTPLGREVWTGVR